MAWTRRGARKGARRLPERQRQRILKLWPNCWLQIPGRCTGKSTEVHHTVDASSYDDPNDPRIDSDDMLVGVCHECHKYVSARDSQRKAMAKREKWKTDPRPHPGVLED